MPFIGILGSASAISYGFSALTSTGSGSALYTTPGTYTWVAPAGVTKVSVLVVGAGGRGADDYNFFDGCFWCYQAGGGGGGGGLAYGNNLTVVPGNSYTVYVGQQAGAAVSGMSYFANSTYLTANGGGNACGNFEGSGGTTTGTAKTAGYTGGAGGRAVNFNSSAGWGTYCTGIMGGAGGGGAAGYSGNGGFGGGAAGIGGNATAVACSGGAAGGGGAPYYTADPNQHFGGGGGGGVGVYGKGSTGALPTNNGGGGGGSGGSSGTANTWWNGGCGGGYGGGGGGDGKCACNFATRKLGANGAVRIIWPGCSRSFPSTNAATP